jgi:predicted PurR-regulated permease PerM
VTTSVPADTVVIPGWLRRLGALSWRLLAIAGLAAVTIWLAVLLGTVTVSVLLSLVVAASFAPLVGRLRARGWSKTKSSALATLLFFLIGVIILLVIALAFVPDLVTFVRSIKSGVAELRTQLDAASLPPAIGPQIQQVADGIQAWLSTALGNVVGVVASVVTVAILSLILTFFVLNDGERGWNWLLQVTTDEKRARIDASGRDALERVGGYLRGTGILSAARAGAYAVFLVVLGVPHVLPLAVFVVLGGFIPYIGPFLAMAAVLLVALGSVGPQATLVLLVLMLIANGIVNNFLRPIVYGRSVHLHPAIILIAIPAGAAVAGIIGVFAAIPVTAFAVAIGGALVDALEPDTGPRSDRLVAGWIDRLAQWSWRLLAAIGVMAVAVFVIAQAPIVVIPVVVAAVIAASVAPIARRLSRRGWGNGRAAAVSVGGTFLLIFLLIGVAVIQVAGPAVDAARAAIAGATDLQDDAGGTLAWVASLAQTFGGNLLNVIATALEAISAIGVVLLLSALLGFYFLRDGSRGWAKVIQRASEWRRVALAQAGSDAVDILGGYMFGTAIISAVGAISQLVIMLVLGLPYAVPVAILSFIACFIPYYGGFITTGLAFLIAVANGSPTQIAIMFVYTIVFNLIQGNVVTPLVYNRAVNLHPAIVLLAIPAGAAVAGVAGMFLAVPVLAVIATTWRTVLYVLDDQPTASRFVPPPPSDEAASVAPMIEGSIPASAE